MQAPSRPAIISGVLILFAAALVARAGYVQIVEHELWSNRATGQQVAEASLPAPRGDIEDATGAVLAHSRELVTLSFSLDLMPDRRGLYRMLLKARVPATRARPVLDAERKWYDLRQNFEPSQVVALRKLTGVRSSPAGDRVSVESMGAREILGRINPEGKGVDGLELLLDSLLQGEPGRARTLRGRDGRRFETPDMLSEPPRIGHTVRLTINQVLQDICDQALLDATRSLDADGGDIVILDPYSGELRCLTSHRRNVRGLSASTIVEPFEPGSTLKPFLVGRLLEMGRARPGEIIETFDGAYAVFGRRITDVHKAARMSVADVIRYSSNVGIARLSERVSDGELYSLYRDLGFGTPTGIPYPVEASGVLYHPSKWSKQSHHSLAIGYELSMTPLQLALAYGSLANGGRLMSPGLIKEIRDGDGNVIFRHQPREVRRVFDTNTTRTVMAMLASVVDSGTATDAELATFDLAGKSGTARRTVAGRYGKQGSQRYTSSFVGLFPAKDPQYVVLVKLDNPRGTYYGGKTAAPVAKSVITAALAARDASLDWGNLPAQRASYLPPALGVGPATAAAASPNGPVIAVSNPLAPVTAAEATGNDSTETAAVPSATVPLVDSTPEPPARAPMRFDLTKPLKEPPVEIRVVAVPDVRGLPLRVAVRELHRAGFQVRLVRGGGDGSTHPAAGERVRTGSLVRLERP
ncbi:MAG: penicillin-binding transpeptidase domain-containing protein [Gemmatimonadaceae bacterium]